LKALALGGDRIDMRRRDFMTLLGGATVLWPVAAMAQSSAMPVIGFLHSASREPFGRLVAAFHEGLNETGYFEGRNVNIEYRWAEGREDMLKPLAADLVHRKVALIVAIGGSFVAVAAKAATATIPVLFISGSDPVQLGLVSSFNRPGGNATGLSLESTEMLAKRLEVLRELVPNGTRIAMLKSSAPTVEKFETEFIERNQLIVLKLGAGKEFDQKEYENQFDAAVKDGSRALLVSADPFFTNWRDLIVALAAKHALPAVYPWRQYAVSGGLASYGPSIIEAYRQIGGYAGRILKGAKPEDLPVQLPTRFELVINLKAATALGLTLPRTMFARANEFIE
jgi:putative tryptophan/tyrosine transport system substrate-binding protein